MTDRKEYLKAYYEAHKEEMKAKMKAYYESHRDEWKAYNQAHKEEKKAYRKAYNQAHKKDRKEYYKAYYQAHREERKVRGRAYNKAHREEQKAYKKAWYQDHREERKAYHESDTNSLGQTKQSIRHKSSYYLFKTLRHTKVEGYEIHHCFGYEDYKKFIYIPKELHLQIHQYLRDNEIDADSDHYSKIEHLIVNYLKSNNRHVLIMNNKENV